MNSVELLAPAGSYEALEAAFLFGADAVYVGGAQFGARAYADNPADTMLLDGIRLAHRLHKRLYLTVNTLVKDAEWETLRQWLRPFYEEGLDAAIVQDPGVASMLRREFPQLPLHASTQMTVTGSYGARWLEERGFSRIILARELSLDEITSIKHHCGLELECFIHGALCYSCSGACLMSSMIGGRSGNRGRCAGICRLPFGVGETPETVFSEDTYPLNMKDLCAVPALPALLATGVTSFKIEGRMKRPEYTAGVVKVYRALLDRLLAGKEGGILPEEAEILYSLNQRDGFTEGYFHTRNGKDMIALHNEKQQRGRAKSGQQILLRMRAEIEKERKGGRLQAPVEGRLALHGETATLHVQETGTGTAGIELYKNGVQRAKSRPMTEEQLRIPMEKTGESQFRFASLQIDLEEGRFVPVQFLKQLRREGFALLEEEIRKDVRRTMPAESTADFEGHHETETQWEAEQSGTLDIKRESDAGALAMILRAEVRDEAQLKTVLAEPQIAAVYLPPALWDLSDLVRQSGKEVWMALPYLDREADHTVWELVENTLQTAAWDGILLRNPEAVAWYRQKKRETSNALPAPLLDSQVYTMNREAIAFYAREGFPARTLPYELSFSELRQQPTEGTEIVLYGRTPVMVTAGCLRKTIQQCRKERGWMFLTDRKNAVFPVEQDCTFCTNVIYNSVPTGLWKERAALRHLRCASGRIALTTETQEEVRRILCGCIALVQGGTIDVAGLPACTKGHFRRGVE